MKYKVGDRVKVKSLQWFNENSDDDYNVVLAGGWYFSKPMSILCGKELIIEKISHATNPPYYMMKDNMFAWTDEMLEGLAEEETVHNKWTGLKVELELSKTVIGVSNVESLHGERFMSGLVKAIIPPEGYQFKDENGNVINATKIVLEKKKREYPKTYKECREILKVGKEHTLEGEILRNNDYKIELLVSFQKLLICRDAYWKIAGEEMGLGKPWEPDWTNEHQVKYTIYTMGNDVIRHVGNYIHAILSFPTEEMRDAFKENFDPDIEICKELL